MAMLRIGKGVGYNRHRPQPVRILLLVAATVALGFLLAFLSFPFLFSSDSTGREKKYLYWGNRIDCPGKCCDQCAGLAHQESSLRCALEEALVLNRIFVMPSRMCLSTIHNTKGILHTSNSTSSEESLYQCLQCSVLGVCTRSRGREIRTASSPPEVRSGLAYSQPAQTVSSQPEVGCGSAYSRPAQAGRLRLVHHLRLGLVRLIVGLPVPSWA